MCIFESKILVSSVTCKNFSLTCSESLFLKSSVKVFEVTYRPSQVEVFYLRRGQRKVDVTAAGEKCMGIAWASE